MPVAFFCKERERERDSGSGLLWLSRAGDRSDPCGPEMFAISSDSIFPYRQPRACHPLKAKRGKWLVTYYRIA